MTSAKICNNNIRFAKAHNHAIENESVIEIQYQIACANAKLEQ